MSSIGLVVKAHAGLEQLPEDWVPEPLGERGHVLALIAQCVPNDHATTLSLRPEAVDESADPRCITVCGVWGPEESGILLRLCQALDARFYDAEAGEFVDL